MTHEGEAVGLEAGVSEVALAKAATRRAGPRFLWDDNLSLKSPRTSTHAVT